MSRLFYHVCQDNAGNLLFGVSGTMRLAGSGTLATIYGDEALTVILPNPMTNHASFGSFKCFLGAGDYDFYMAKSGYNFETLTGVQGHGTMAQQDAHAVAITGGTATGLTSLMVAYGGGVGIQVAVGSSALAVAHNKATPQTGIDLIPYGSDTGTARSIRFLNLASSEVGSIVTTATTTAYTTASDARLKHAIEKLVGSLDILRVLNPVRFRWNADDSVGNGFLAHELQHIIPEAVTDEPDSVNDDGSVKPQQVDHSRLVVFLVGAVQELLKRVEALEELVTAS